MVFLKSSRDNYYLVDSSKAHCSNASEENESEDHSRCFSAEGKTGPHLYANISLGRCQWLRVVKSHWQNVIMLSIFFESYRMRSVVIIVTVSSGGEATDCWSMNWSRGSYGWWTERHSPSGDRSSKHGGHFRWWLLGKFILRESRSCRRYYNLINDVS